MKKMVPFMSEIGTQLARKFDRVLETSDQEFQLKPVFRSCTMDIICHLVFGVNIDSQVNTKYKLDYALGYAFYPIRCCSK